MDATFTEERVSACTDVSTDSTGMHGSMCSYISTKGTGVHVVMSTDESKVKTVVRGRKNVCDENGRNKPIWDIGTDVVGKVRKGISYTDALHQGSQELMKL